VPAAKHDMLRHWVQWGQEGVKSRIYCY